MKQCKLLTTRFISILSAGFRQISWEMFRRQIPSPARPGKQESFSEWSGAVQKGLNLIYGGREFDNGARRTGACALNWNANAKRVCYLNLNPKFSRRNLSFCMLGIFGKLRRHARRFVRLARHSSLHDSRIRFHEKNF